MTVQRGATLLLYTDGLVEGRDLPLDEGIARLKAALAELADEPLAELCDEVIERLRPAGPAGRRRAGGDPAAPGGPPAPAEAGPRAGARPGGLRGRADGGQVRGSSAQTYLCAVARRTSRARWPSRR